jgi:cytoskeletal protein RodZ
MKTVGEILSEERKKRGIKIKTVAEVTKIRPRFVKAIEENNFSKLPSAPITHGFIKNYADFLDLSPRFVLAVFRRDFIEDQKGKIVPRGLVKPLDSPKFLRSSKLGFFLLTIIFLIGVLVYLTGQYLSLIRGPSLEIITPLDQSKIDASFLEVKGKTEPDAVVRVNGGIINISSEGEFICRVSLNEGENTIVIEATNRLDKTRKILRKVFRE